MSSIFDYPDIIDSLTADFFHDISNYVTKQKIFKQFYVQRIREGDLLLSKLKDLSYSGNNILVVGDMGVGKTVFLECFLNRLCETKRDAMYHFCEFAKPGSYNFLDLRKHSFSQENIKEFINYFRNELVNVMLQLFQTLGVVCNTIPALDHTDATYTARYEYCSNKLNSLGLKKNAECTHFLFIDDVDYIDSEILLELIENLRPILQSPYICVILAARIPAYNTIMSYHDHTISNTFKNSEVIPLAPLSAYDILLPRIQFLYKNGNSMLDVLKNTDILAVMPTLQRFKDKIIQILGDDPNVPFEYPFTSTQHVFMEKMSNGNVSMILQYAKELLKYMNANKKDITKKEQGYWIGRDAIFRIFSNITINEKIRIFNLHDKRTNMYKPKSKNQKDQKVGNSISVIVLETFRDNEWINTTDVESLEELYGVSVADFKDSINRLVALRLLNERVFYNARKASKSPIASYPELVLTSRGNFYLENLIFWDAYKTKYGVSNHHKYGLLTRLQQTIFFIIKELIANILIAITQNNLCSTDKFKINKQTFYKNLMLLYKHIINSAICIGDKTVFTLNPEYITNLLNKHSLLEKNPELDDSKYYLFSIDSLEKSVFKENFYSYNAKLKNIYNHDEFFKIVKSMVIEVK
ncbi:MAG: ATP-binding protein [Nitrospirae bacterium]|nr:ATP-binding protein [Nitrospirota bacterium]